MSRPPDQQVIDFLAGHDSPAGELALTLREILLEEVPEALEKVYRNHPRAAWYGRGPKMSDMFCYIARAATHVNLGFCRGASLPDPQRVLEGEGRLMRHVKLRSLQDLQRPFVRRYIRAAARQSAQVVAPRHAGRRRAR
jgi:hypothetical protein